MSKTKEVPNNRKVIISHNGMQQQEFPCDRFVVNDETAQVISVNFYLGPDLIAVLNLAPGQSVRLV